jgi:hypothetical protein
MKLFVFRPKYHGPRSFFVMAETEEKARQAVDAYLKVDEPESWPGDYKMEIYELNQVAENDNE